MISPNLKRLLLIIGLILATLALAFALFSFFKKTAPTTYIPPSGGQTPGGQLPTAGEREPGANLTTTTGGLTPGNNVISSNVPGTPPSYYQPTASQQVVSDQISYPSIGTGGNMRYYDVNDGKFYRLASDGQVKAMSGQVFYNVQKITWSKSNDKAILEYPDGNKILYNFEKQTQITIPKHWEDFSFSPDSSQFASKSIGLSPENRWLTITNDDGTGTKLIEPLGENANKVTVSWSPSRQVVAFSRTGEPLGADRQEVLFIGLNNENFKSAIVEGEDFRPLWSPTGKRLLYSVYSGRTNYVPELWIVDSYGDNIGGNRQTIKLNTWADKCTFQSDLVLYCAVPRSLPQGAGILPEVANGIYDDIYKVDLSTGLRVTVPTDGDYQINELSYDKINNRLFFTADNNNGMFEVKM